MDDGQDWLSADRKAVEKSGLFHPDWYARTYPDVAVLGLEPLEHFVLIGHRLGRDPGPGFSTADYRRRNPGLGREINPLVHYLRDRQVWPASWDTRPAAGARPDAAALPARAGIYADNLGVIAQASPVAGLLTALRRSEAAVRRPPAAATGSAPLVSVIMPSRNRAFIIGDAIASVLEQSYANWELLVCDDGSSDATRDLVVGRDARIRYLPLEQRGAAAARNAGLAAAGGEIIAYLDTDNLWHPEYLTRMVAALAANPGHSAAYCSYVDFHIDRDRRITVQAFERPAFVHERLIERNFLDLNCFMHRRELPDVLGGFNEALTRRQDYDLILKYTWLRDPLFVPEVLALYHRNDGFPQITVERQDDFSSNSIVEENIGRYFRSGLPLREAAPFHRVTVLSWDLSRNHFAKAYAVAEALADKHEVQLVSFRFFEEEMFPPLRDAKPRFRTDYFEGADFPAFFDTVERALEAINGDLIYVLKPRLPSLGVALLANARRGIPVVLEVNDLETVAAQPGPDAGHTERTLSDVAYDDPGLISPHGAAWSELLTPVARAVPVITTHNSELDAVFGRRAVFLRNSKNEAVYDPARYDRPAVRAQFGFQPDDRVILFGGMIRRHKGVHELPRLVEALSDPRYKLVFAASRLNPDADELARAWGDRVTILPPQDAVAMAQLNLAADVVLLWLDPEVPASRYQMPYKLTDALAMGPAILANDISDLGELGRQGYLDLVPYGDIDAAAKAVSAVFEDQPRRDRMRKAARRLFLRQFSYAATRGSFALAANRAARLGAGALPVAATFTRWFDGLHRALVPGWSGSTSIQPQLSLELPLRAPDRPLPPSPPAAAPAAVPPAAPTLIRPSDAGESFAFYRIIGNDLYPRHKRGQSRENVQFILENEPPLPSAERRWLVNRIVDKAEEEAIIGLLDKHKQTYLHLPFVESEYRKIGWNLDILRHIQGVPKPGTAKYRRLQAALYRHKNNYLIHNNGARNAALRDGRARARWVLPWDGNCFLTEAAWDAIRRGAASSDTAKYVVVPMQRMLSNEQVLDRSFVPDAQDEPQLMFRNDAREEFNADAPYGRRPKVEIFWRLGIPGVWDTLTDDPWDVPRLPQSEEAGLYVTAGWVARLFSGVANLETATTESNSLRAAARQEAFVSLVDLVDTMIHGRPRPQIPAPFKLE